MIAGDPAAPGSRVFLSRSPRDLLYSHHGCRPIIDWGRECLHPGVNHM